MFGISDQEMDEMGLIEATLDANMAACALKLQEYKKALDYAKMVLNCCVMVLIAKCSLFRFNLFHLLQSLAFSHHQALSLDKSNKKALFRQAQALMFLDRYNEAKQVCVDAIREEPNNVDFRKLLDDIKRTDAEKTQKQKAFEMEMAQRMSERLASTAISS
jgi:tetratricopeptide (TPR) repeat protein